MTYPVIPTPPTPEDALPAQPIPVYMVNQTPPRQPDRPATMNTFNIPALATADPIRILPHAPKRCRAVLTIVGQSTDVGIIASSFADAQKRTGAMCMGLQVIELWTTDEIWFSAFSATSFAVGVVAEFEK